ncbi:cactin-like protein [Cryptosporidium hominis]
MEISNEIEFEKKLQLKRCRESRESIIKDIGYSDEFNPFGDNNLSLPFIWEKKFEQEKKSSSFKQKCNAYPWYQFGVCPINTAEIIEIKKRRENFEEKLQTRNVSNNHFDYGKWIENEKNFEKLQLQSSSIIRIREHRENLFDTFFWKLLIYSYFKLNSTLSPIPSLIKTGLSASISYLISLKDKKLFKLLDEIFITHPNESNDCISLLIQIVSKHKQLSSTNTDLLLIPEWQDILDGLEILLKAKIDELNKNANFYQSDDQEINEILNNKEINELKDIMFQSQELADEDYWKRVAVITKVRICKLNVEIVEKTYYECFEKWASLLISKYNIIIQDDNNCANEKIINSADRISNTEEIYNQYDDHEKVDQLIDLPLIEFSQSNERYFSNRSGYQITELILPCVYSMIKARYYWNQYNKNYYSNETLPPKIIQGYKFKIKYPLLGKAENSGIIPRWYITTKDKYLKKNKLLVTNEEVLLKVHEDIIFCENEISVMNKLLIITCDHKIYKDVGFSIIDKEWDLNPRSGFKSYFENSTLYLNFNFKQTKYKR